MHCKAKNVSHKLKSKIWWNFFFTNVEHFVDIFLYEYDKLVSHNCLYSTEYSTVKEQNGAKIFFCYSSNVYNAFVFQMQLISNIFSLKVQS